ncbi:MAG TPA: TonB-dependent receptor plug domain-containing protein [Candidatus Acidoferrum sp.]|nr:TonB-dependent receptor plug domain-containing protein [Candidatus Acidoferrum sp.]
MVSIATSLMLLSGLVTESHGDSAQTNPKAAQRLTHVSLEDLGQIEVTTASKVPVKATRTPAAIYVITQEDIRRSGATSIPEALRMAPGVEVARVDSNTWSLGVRGFESTLSRSVLVLIDGRSVYTPLFAGVYWQVQDTLLEDIDRIEIIRGPGGTIWGANAVNAVINIITKRAQETHGTLVSTGGGNVDQGFVNFRYGAGNSKGLNYRIYGKAFTRGPEFHPDHKQFDDWRMGQTGFRTDWDTHNRDRLTLQGDIYYGDAGQRVGITSYSPPFMTNVEQNAELSGGNLLGRWERELGSGSNVQLQTYYDRTNRKQANFAESRDTFDIDFVHHLILRGRQDFLWGLGARLSSGNVSEVVSTVVFTPNHYTDKLYNAFIQDEIPIVGDQLSLTIGSKFLHNNYSGFEIQPTVRLLWTPSSRQTVWGAVTRAVRTPSRVEEDLQLTALLAPSPLTFFRISGDRNFSSESLVGYEAGYRSLVGPKFYVDIAAFYNNYNNLLSIEPGAPFAESSPPPPHAVIPLFFRNGLLGNTAGFEIAPDWTPTRTWRLRGSYSYLHIALNKKASSLDASTANSTQGSSPHHQVAIQSSLDLPKKLEFDQTFRYVSSLPAQLVRAYTTADVRFSWHATRSLDVSVVGQNLFQPHHPEFGGDPGSLVGIERSAYIKLTWQSWQR